MHEDIKEIAKLPDSIVIPVILGLICIGCTLGATMWQARHPLPMSYARKADLAAKMIDRIEPLKVRTESFQREAFMSVPASCARLAAREGERIPATSKEVGAAKARVRAMARKGDVLAKQCERDMERQT